MTTSPTARHRARRAGTVGPQPRGGPGTSGRASAIADAALRQLNEVGYGKVTMESVACEAGVARATIYRRYRDKADLITAAIAGNSTVPLVRGSPMTRGPT